MRPRHLLPLPALLLAGCGRIDELASSPPVTPQQWCEQRPCIDIGGTIVNEPLGSFLVFFLAGLWVAVGGYFLATRRGQRSRVWLGVALVLGGIGAAQAGISYQAFSYELKCDGRDVCALTSGFEVGYSLTQAWSISAMLVAVGYACTRPGMRRAITWYALANALLYCAVLIAGVMMPSALLLSFTVLMLFAVPGIVIVMVVSWSTNRTIFTAALLLIGVNVAYYVYWAAGFTAALYQNGDGFYFSENDVLHVGYIAWLIYIAVRLGPTLADRNTSPIPLSNE